MFIQFIFALINYVFDLPHRQVELFRKAVERDSIKKPSFEDLSVPLGVSADYPIIDQLFNFGS
jgi:hypothetical protein